MVGAILVQRTTWTNTLQAIGNLKAADALSPAAIRDMDEDALREIIRPSGFYNTKARKLRALCEYLAETCDDDISAMSEIPTDALREGLLSVYGIGNETADDIMLYGFGRPLFVVDAYTRRILGRMGLIEPNIKYEALQAMFHDDLPRDVALYNEYHGLIVLHAKTMCKTRPDCSECPLAPDCPRVGV